jgi:ATP-dependent exoDNAse (exonuclease V) beta subunit
LAGESAYICTFYDKLQAYITELSSDINGFLREWEEKLYKENIQGTDVDGIRIMTMHKSKGLEAESVILPYCDWKLEKTKNNILLCNTDVPPFSDLALVPIDYSSRMEGSVYALDYYEEKLQNSVDNLNLLYVAFTRARRNLFIIGKDEKKDDEKKKNGKQQDKANKESLRSDLILLCLKEVSDRLVKINPEISNSIISNQGGGTCFEYGEITISKEKERVEKTENVFLQDYEKLPIELKQQTPHLEFKQSNDSKHFIENIDDDSDDSAGYIKIGSVLHNVLSNITTIADVDDALKKLENEGVLYDENISFEKISSMLRKRLSSPRVADWYSGKWEVFNECTILSLDSSTGLVIEKRPDRVMRNGDEVIVVDFKFGKENDDYRKQVRFYMEKLEEMGYINVKGVLWYVYANKFDEV